MESQQNNVNQGTLGNISVYDDSDDYYEDDDSIYGRGYSDDDNDSVYGRGTGYWSDSDEEIRPVPNLLTAITPLNQLIPPFYQFLDSGRVAGIDNTLIYAIRIQQLFRVDRFSNSIDIPLIQRPVYDEDMEQLNDAADFMSNQLGELYIYRHSQGRFVHVEMIHLYGPSRFTCNSYCGCIFCIEARDRIINNRVGYYDYLPSQIAGTFDTFPLETDLLYLPPLVPELQLPHIQQQQQQQQADLPVAIRFGDGENCVICLSPVEGDELQSFTGCGHSAHFQCLQHWVLVNSVCPLCRSPIDIGRAEARFDFLVEYANADELGELDYDDPKPYIDIVPGKRMYHCYIVTVKSGFTLVVKGAILQIIELSNERILTKVTNEFKIVPTYDIEIQVISSEHIQLALTENSDFTIKNGQSELIGIFGLGTYGDIRPLELLADQYRKSGFEVFTVFPNGFSADYNYDWLSVEKAYQASPTAIPSLSMFGSSVFNALGALVELLTKVISERKPQFIIASPHMLTLEGLCARHNIPIVIQRSIPSQLGAITFLDQRTKWHTWMAQLCEKFIKSMSNRLMYLSTMWENDGENLNANSEAVEVLTVAPEFCEEGVGNLILQNATDTGVGGSYDLYFGLGSMIQKSVEEKMIKLLQQTNFKVLFQTSNYSGTSKNITFIGKCNHEDVFRNVNIVICHGGAGTLQTAVRHGCRVLVYPCWVDQKFWPRHCRAKGYDVQMLSDDELENLRMIRGMSNTKQQSISSISIEELAQKIMDCRPKPKEIGDGFFIFSSSIPSLKLLEKVESLIFSDSRAEHVGIGHYDKQTGLTRYIELRLNGFEAFVEESTGCGIDKRIHHVLFIDIPFDTLLFRSCIPKVYSLFDNCRTVVDKYLKYYNAISLDEWHNMRKLGVRQYFDGSKRTNSTTEVLEFWPQVLGAMRTFYSKVVQLMSTERTFMDIPHKLVDVSHDGQCLFTSIERQLGVTLDRKEILKSLNGFYADFQVGKKEKLDKIPYFTSEIGNCIPLAIALSHDLRLAIYSAETKHVYLVNDNGRKTIYLYLEQEHYQSVEFTVSNDVELKDTFVKEDDFTVIGTFAAADGVFDQKCIRQSKHIEVETYSVIREHILDIEKRYRLKDRKRLEGGIVDAVFCYTGDGKRYVIKVSTDKVNTYLIYTSEIKRSDYNIYIYLMPYFYDDCLPVQQRHIVRQQQFPFLSDLHRGNLRSFRDKALPIDQVQANNEFKLDNWYLQYFTRDFQM